MSKKATKYELQISSEKERLCLVCSLASQSCRLREVRLDYEYIIEIIEHALRGIRDVVMMIKMDKSRAL